MKRALIVEDDVAHQYILRTLVKRYGCEVDMAPNGFEAMALVNSKPYDLVLLDLKMPLVDGYEVLRHMDDHAPGLLRSTVVISAWKPEDLDALVRRYDVSVITKPFDSDTVSDSIRSILER